MAAFQSLLYWIGCWNADALRSIEHEIEFQSLLYWIGCWNQRHASTWPSSRSGFNPCCIGLGAGTVSDRLAARSCARCVSILVVLDWVLEPLSTMRMRPVEYSGFNPCCIGLGAGTLICIGSVSSRVSGFNPCCIGLGAGTRVMPISSVVHGRLFQSLLYWIGCWNLLCRMQLRGLAAVSILVVLDWVLEPLRGCARVAAGNRFQSLLYWIGCWNRCQLRWHEASVDYVSILVVLDWVLEL